MTPVAIITGKRTRGRGPHALPAAIGLLPVLLMAGHGLLRIWGLVDLRLHGHLRIAHTVREAPGRSARFAYWAPDGHRFEGRGTLPPAGPGQPPRPEVVTLLHGHPATYAVGAVTWERALAEGWATLRRLAWAAGAGLAGAALLVWRRRTRGRAPNGGMAR